MSILFACTLFLAAALLMLVQPLCARVVLPGMGGTPNVWNTCMLFFQTGLLIGYGYAHWSSRWLRGWPRVAGHLTLLLLAWLMLPIALPRPETPTRMPTLWLLQTLGVGVALPFVVIAGSGPLLQRWFADAHLGNPYFLYVASNAGSFTGLLAYPLIVEPWLTLEEQSQWWRWGYLVLLAATMLCGSAVWRRVARPKSSKGVADSTPFEDSERATPRWRQRSRWLLLALVPSSLLLSVTNYLTTDIAAIPLLWVVPLALYLLTFMVVFAARPIIPQRIVNRWLPLAVIVLMLLFVREAADPLLPVLALHLLGFFWIALGCHGELAQSKPAPAHLTEFYFWLALGGALGGACNTLLAPLVFSSYAEYPLMIAVAAALRPNPKRGQDLLHSEVLSPFRVRWDWLAPACLAGATALAIMLSSRLRLDPTVNMMVAYLLPLAACYLLQSRPLRFGLSVAAVLFASQLDPGVHGRASVRMRSFYGVHRVTEQDGMRRLVHGNTVHGQQFVYPAKRREALAYYHATGPIGRLFTALEKDPRLQRVGLVGLGAGSLAAYAQTGQRWTFFEIDPSVVHLARDSGLFTFLHDSHGELSYVVGDARLTLQQSSKKFGLLVIDAFGSDAIPWHLLTREALQLYRQRLQEDGILAFHISNRYVDLEPVLADHARAMGLTCTLAEDLQREAIALNPGKLASTWLFLAAQRIELGPVAFRTRTARPLPGLRPWTDDFVNLLQVLRWRAE